MDIKEINYEVAVAMLALINYEVAVAMPALINSNTFLCFMFYLNFIIM